MTWQNREHDPELMINDDEVDFIADAIRRTFENHMKDPQTYQDCIRTAAVFHAVFFQLRDDFNRMMGERLGHVPIIAVDKKPKWWSH